MRRNQTWVKCTLGILFLLLLIVSGLLKSLPAQAQESTVDYTLTELQYRDFSNQNLERDLFCRRQYAGG